MALKSANHHATYFDYSLDHYGTASILDAARAGELLFKATIAKQHPLLIFRDIFSLKLIGEPGPDLDSLIASAKTHDFSVLPNILWLVTGEKISDPEIFELVRARRNALQHFFHHDTWDSFAESSRFLAFKFIYRNLDPILFSKFGMCAIENFEHQADGYEYTVHSLLRMGERFSVPGNFNIGEEDPNSSIEDQCDSYKIWFSSEMEKSSGEIYSTFHHNFSNVAQIATHIYPTKVQRLPAGWRVQRRFGALYASQAVLTQTSALTSPKRQPGGRQALDRRASRLIPVRGHRPAVESKNPTHSPRRPDLLHPPPSGSEHSNAPHTRPPPPYRPWQNRVDLDPA
ncbi:hypothetical protein [Puniceibacterium sp. IMCC21224]|uniref:hypothetical protein n=1 Tax=Puniceibacterium sp. IMCC21224 TaxID=1618204 RepID=UPI00065D16E4|nr:hypothetical protein [Puniceibacterium sp. IMCC21224]KMK66813.1 hypothetical protein IMCC21224_111670 [Puniceibacterium sp. IMCC21224]